MEQLKEFKNDGQTLRKLLGLTSVKFDRMITVSPTN